MYNPNYQNKELKQDTSGKYFFRQLLPICRMC
nr:MAG TPA: hypothetical protein [Caudoviricetes sp.]